MRELLLQMQQQRKKIEKGKRIITSTTTTTEDIPKDEIQTMNSDEDRVVETNTKTTEKNR